MEVKHTMLLEFLAGRSAFVLDGRLYRTLENGQRPYDVRGTASFADIEVDQMQLRISRPKETKTISLRTPVTWCNDVCVVEGNQSRVQGENRLLRYAYPKPWHTWDTFMQTRVRYGLFDFQLFRDNIGRDKTVPDKFGEPVVYEVQPPAFRLTDLSFDGSKSNTALVFTPVNAPDVGEDRDVVMFNWDPKQFVWAGPSLTFSSPERAEAGKELGQ